MPSRRERYWKTTFGHWVSSYGVAALVKDLGTAGEPIHFNTVYRWLSGSVYVRPSIALKIVELSGEALSLPDIYHHRKELAALETRPEGSR